MNVLCVIKAEKVVTGLFLLKVTQSYPVLPSKKEIVFLVDRHATKQPTTLNRRLTFSAFLSSAFLHHHRSVLVLFSQTAPFHSENTPVCLFKPVISFIGHHDFYFVK